MPLILLVEDDPTMQDLYQQSLQAHGFDVALAVNGLDALAKSKEKHPDLVLSDLMMPQMDGFHMMERFKKESDLKKIPIVVLTNLVEQNDIRRATELGAVEVIVKSEHEPREVMEIITRVLDFDKDEPVKVAA